jgi:hypothetical protein
MARFALIIWDGSLCLNHLGWLALLQSSGMARFASIIWDGSLCFNHLGWLALL